MKELLSFLLLINTVWSNTTRTLCDVCDCEHSNRPADNFTMNINCSKRDIGDTLEYLAIPKNVRDMDLSNNNLVSAGVGNHKVFIQMRKLCLKGNSIRSIVEPDFYHVSITEELDLSHNHIVEIIGKPFHYLKDLQKLDLSGNNLREIPEDSFKYLNDLQELILNGNPLHQLGPHVVSDLPSLVRLQLSRAALKDIHHNSFKGTDSLQFLDLTANNLERVPTKSFEHLPVLEHIVLDGNPIQLIDQSSFWFPINLIVIDLNEMPSLREINELSFSRLKHLQKVSISNNKLLRNLNAKAFEGSGSLHDINLSQNALTTIENGEDLRQLCSDSDLDLSGNPWNCDCNVKWMVECASIGNETDILPTCFKPDSKRGFKMSLLTEDEMTCDDDLWMWGVVRMDKELGIALIVFGVLGILASVCGIAMMIRFKPRIAWNKRIKDKNEDIYYVRMKESDPSNKEASRFQASAIKP